MAVERPDGPIQDLAVIDGFVIDCLISDNHTLDSEITEFPVEGGGTISDNIRPKPIVIAMECLVSNTPLEPASRFRGAGSVPVDDFYALLKSIRKDRRLVSISTSLEDWDNMGLEALGIPRAAGRGDELRVHTTWKQVDVVENVRGDRVAIQAARSGQNEYKPVRATGTKYIYVNTADETWYDDDILAWRESIRFTPQFHGIETVADNINAFIARSKNTSGVQDGQWLIHKDRPILIPRKTWNSRTIDQNRDQIVKPELITLQGGVKPMLYKKPFSYVRMLRPGEYVLESLVQR